MVVVVAKKYVEEKHGGASESTGPTVPRDAAELTGGAKEAAQSLAAAEAHGSAHVAGRLPLHPRGIPGHMTWKGMQKNCMERYCELANKKIEHKYKVSTPCLDDHLFEDEDLETVGELSKVCPQIVLKSARIVGPDILWSINYLSGAFTKWSKVSARLISIIHFTNGYKQYYHVGNSAPECRPGLFQDADFAGDLKHSKATSGRMLFILGSHAFVPITWTGKKQTAVSHRAVGRRDKDVGTKGRLRVVKHHKEPMEKTDTRVKEAAGQSSNKSTEIFQHA